MLLCGKKNRDVWSQNESVRAEIGQILRTHTRAAKLVVEIPKKNRDVNLLKEPQSLKDNYFKKLRLFVKLY